MTSEGKTTVYEGEALEEKKNGAFPLAQLSYFTTDAIQVTLLGIADIKGVPHYKLKIEDGEELKFEYYNVETGLLSSFELYRTTEEGEESSFTTISSYELMDGLLLPKKISISSEGQVLNIETIKVITSSKVKSKAYSGKFKKVEKLLLTL